MIPYEPLDTEWCKSCFFHTKKKQNSIIHKLFLYFRHSYSSFNLYKIVEREVFEVTECEFIGKIELRPFLAVL